MEVICSCAVVAVWSDPDLAHLTRTHGTVWSSTLPGQGHLETINVKEIATVVAMIPHKLNNEERYFLGEKPGLGFIGYVAQDGDEEDGDQDVFDDLYV
jgi:hypothetical protein